MAPRASPGAIVKVGLQVAAAFFQLPQDIFVQQLPMAAPLPRSPAQVELRKAVDKLMDDEVEPWASNPGYALYEDKETNFVNEKMKLLKPGTAKIAAEEMSEAGKNQNDFAKRKYSPATYGEVTVAGARQLFFHMGLTNCPSSTYESCNNHVVFLDLGSGRGRLVLQAYMELPQITKAMGIELAPNRHRTAVDAWEKLQSMARNIRAGQKEGDMVVPDAEIEFLSEDFLESDLSQVTHIYISSLCFPDNLMYHIANKLEKEAPKLQCVATIRPFPTEFEKRGIRDRINYEVVSKVFGMIKRSEYVDMTWTQQMGGGCEVHFYTKAPPLFD
jgi:Histone methylation protein DOT1